MTNRCNCRLGIRALVRANRCGQVSCGSDSAAQLNSILGSIKVACAWFRSRLPRGALMPTNYRVVPFSMNRRMVAASAATGREAELKRLDK
jgi:hypothetical protein